MRKISRTSSGVKTSLNLLKLSLTILCETPVPGISAVAVVLLEVLKRTQEMQDNAAGWKNLGKGHPSGMSELKEARFSSRARIV
ncbi:hypothetical protein K438DRAFT_712724 [Mycena galopus ATCC 62051]|nr:hypothetical protein K438DRAFT_712724 [Mycena galopus ATCC 62051]